MLLEFVNGLLGLLVKKAVALYRKIVYLEQPLQIPHIPPPMPASQEASSRLDFHRQHTPGFWPNHPIYPQLVFPLKGSYCCFRPPPKFSIHFEGKAVGRQKFLQFHYKAARIPGI